MKFLLYQLLAVGIIWTGMAFFYKDMDEASKVIFYVVTTWMLFIIVLTGKKWIRDLKTKNIGKSERG